MADWLERYDHARSSYIGGFISRIEAIDALMALRYRDDALRIEILEWERAKRQRQQRIYRTALIEHGQTQKRIDPPQESAPGRKESIPCATTSETESGKG